MTGGQQAAPPRRDQDWDRDWDRDGCGPAGVRRPEPPRAAHRHTRTHTRTGPARDPPQIPAPRRRAAGSRWERCARRRRAAPARHGTAAVCLNPQPDPCPGVSPLRHPHWGLKGVCASPERLRGSGSGALGTAPDAVRLLEFKSVANRTGLCPAACRR